MTSKRFHIDPAKLRRKRGDRTQVEVARSARMTQSAYSRIESGQRPDPAYSTAGRIAEALGMKMEEMR